MRNPGMRENMADQEFDNLRARLNHSPDIGRNYGHGDFFRDVVNRPGTLTRFRRWMKKPLLMHGIKPLRTAEQRKPEEWI